MKTVETKQADVRVDDAGSMFIVTGLTKAGRKWVTKNLEHAETIRLGLGVVVEHRYIDPIIEGMIEAGLIVGDK